MNRALVSFGLIVTLLIVAACAPAKAAHSTANGSGSGQARGARGGSAAGTGTSGRSPSAGPAQAPFGFRGRHVVSPDGVGYTFYSGTAPSFDGLPLAADVTVPDGAHTPLPLIVMLHGWGQSRTAWESATRSNANPNVSGWNNVAFAAQGYAVLNYTARGWHDSCGPDSASVPDNPATLPPACTSRAYWVHLADPRWEVHDAQWLIGELADEGVADPGRIGVTGGSYGGGQSWLLALLNDRTMLANGQLVPWTSPQRHLKLHIAAAVPEYTWSSLSEALLPNGRATAATLATPALFDNPVGVPIQSYETGLYADGPALGNGFYAPPGADPTADLTTWYARVSAGNPYSDDPAKDPVTAASIAQLDIRSPLYLQPDATVPVFQVQGLTDPLFPPVHALLMRNMVLHWNPRYPIGDFFGDVGHSNANNPADVWAAANAQGRAFFAHYLQGKGPKPAPTITAMTTACMAGQSRQTFSAPSWQALASHIVTFASAAPQATSNTASGPEGPDTDPIVHSGCLGTAAREGTGVAAWSFAPTMPFTLLGQPRLTVGFLSTGTDVELDVRLWDVSPDGSAFTLVSRGTYRSLGMAGKAARVTFETSANAWQVLPGHTLRLEVVGNDSPYFQADNVPAATTITSVSLALPAR